MLAHEHRAVWRTCRRAVSENGVGRGAFIEYFGTKPRGDRFQLRHDHVGLQQIKSFCKPVSAAADFEHAQVQRFDPLYKVPYSGAGKTQCLREPPARVKLAVGENAKQWKVGDIHAWSRKQSPCKY
jgi:hypothetical protein